MSNKEYQDFVIKTTVTTRGRVIRITPSLLAYLVELERRVGDDKAVIQDESGRPVIVDNVREFVNMVWNRYHEALNDYHDRLHENMRRHQQVADSPKESGDKDE